MNHPIRWGILSTGHIARKFVSDLRLLPDAEVVAVASRSLPVARAFADRHGIPKAHGSWSELAHDPEVDVVYVACPTSTHDVAALTCLHAGKPVLVEKPFALDLARSRAMVAAARERGVFLMEAMWMRCLPVIRTVVQLVRQGEIGTVTAVSATFGLPGPFPPGHRLRDPALGGGALLDLGVYPVTLAHLILGPPDRVVAHAQLTPDHIDEVTAALLGYRNGAVASISCSLVGYTANTAAIAGTSGRVELPSDFFRAQEYAIVRADGRRERTQMRHPGFGYQYEAQEVQRCLRQGLTESPLVPLEETLEVMGTLDAIRATWAGEMSVTMATLPQSA